MTDELFEWLKQTQGSTEYLSISQLEDGMAYAIWARNAYVGVWLAKENGFLISRYKLNPEPFLFVELHWDLGEPYGTAKPLRPLEKCPFTIPPSDDYYGGPASQALCNWLDDLEKLNSPVPGHDTVAARRSAGEKWLQKEGKKRAMASELGVPVHKRK